jgi:hypothetical protein
MAGADPFGLVVALGLIFACVLVGAALLHLWDKIVAAVLRSANLDRCLTCGKLLTYHPSTGTYDPHRCRHR